MSPTADAEVFRRTRFLLVDTDKGAINAIEKFLLACGSPQVHKAPAPIEALRVLQDAHAKVDCVICTHRKGNATGVQFLQGLRAGRWGGTRIQHVKFILMMMEFDLDAVQAADRSGVSGYYIGVPRPRALAAAIVKALTSEKGVSPLPALQVAHVNVSGADFVLVPIDESFAHADPSVQQNTVGQLQNLMREQQLAGAVTPVWETADHGLGYFAAPEFHAQLSGITPDFVQTNLNREMTVLRPPPFAKLSSPGSEAYTAYLKAEDEKVAGMDDVLDLSGFEVKPDGGKA